MPRTSSNLSTHSTRQTTLTQIDFVKRLRPPDNDPEVELDFDEDYILPLAKKRRTTSSSRREPPEDVATGPRRSARRHPLRRGEELPSGHATISKAKGRRSEPDVVLEIPSSPGKPPPNAFKRPPLSRPLLERSLNTPERSCTPTRKRRLRGPPPPLEVRESIVEGGETAHGLCRSSSDFSQSLAHSPSPLPRKKEVVVTKLEPMRPPPPFPTTRVHKVNNAGPVERKKNVEIHPGLRAGVLEIRDSEGEEESDDDMAGGAGLIPVDPFPAVVGEGGTRADDGRFSPAAKLDRCQAEVGADTPTAVEVIDLSADGHRLERCTKWPEEILAESPLGASKLPKTPAVSLPSSPAGLRPVDNEDGSEEAAAADKTPNPGLRARLCPPEQAPARLPSEPPNPIQNTPSDTEESNRPGDLASALNVYDNSPPFADETRRRLLLAPPAAPHSPLLDSSPPPFFIPASSPPVAAVDDIVADTDADDDYDDDDAAEPTNDDIHTHPDDVAPLTTSQLLPDSLMHSWLPPAPPLLFSTQDDATTVEEEVDD
ncbi:MAG: hypothetical protein M1826_006218 [Phylliscum demangeonii]|nr:MAG: hypothetical protein M1826_006218 [Phylliscum demangeonii]